MARPPESSFRVVALPRRPAWPLLGLSGRGDGRLKRCQHAAQAHARPDQRLVHHRQDRDGCGAAGRAARLPGQRRQAQGCSLRPRSGLHLDSGPRPGPGPRPGGLPEVGEAEVRVGRPRQRWGAQTPELSKGCTRGPGPAVSAGRPAGSRGGWLGPGGSGTVVWVPGFRGQGSGPGSRLWPAAQALPVIFQCSSGLQRGWVAVPSPPSSAPGAPDVSPPAEECLRPRTCCPCCCCPVPTMAPGGLGPMS